MAGSTGDVTLEKDLAQQRDVFFQDLKAVLDTIDYGVLFMGRDLRAKIINRAFRQMWGISDEFILKRPTMSDLILLQSAQQSLRRPTSRFRRLRRAPRSSFESPPLRHSGGTSLHSFAHNLSTALRSHGPHRQGTKGAGPRP
jgi:PAS domain-containing protein